MLRAPLLLWAWIWRASKVFCCLPLPIIMSAPDTKRISPSAALISVLSVFRRPLPTEPSATPVLPLSLAAAVPMLSKSTRPAAMMLRWPLAAVAFRPSETILPCKAAASIFWPAFNWVLGARPRSPLWALRLRLPLPALRFNLSTVMLPAAMLKSLAAFRFFGEAAPIKAFSPAFRLTFCVAAGSSAPTMRLRFLPACR